MTRDSARTQSDWNEIDWYVNFGEANASRNWDDARKYGFVSAGGRRTYSDAIQKMQVGDRVFAYTPKVGYAGVGTVTGPAAPADHTSLTVDGKQVSFRSLEVNAPYGKEVADPDPEEDYREWIVPVSWERTVDRERALRIPGLFANPNTACRLRDQFTIDQVTEFFGIAASAAR
ncbi:MAG: hypothetical protein WAX14_11130 [Rhodococcus sp. (in: high G+C Gram-positive bacteria)]|uniref:hypothetical protein n=1 Tax=Rhodococcus sp. TaxID=1831 RepID=UPI003BB5C130